MIYFLLILCILELAAIILLGLYIKRYLIKNLVNVNINMAALMRVVIDYEKHLGALSSMESYSGEPIIENFINHTKFVRGYLQDFKTLHLNPSFDTFEEEDIKDMEENNLLDDNTAPR